MVFPKKLADLFRTLLCRSNGSINYTARAAVHLYVSLGTRAEWRTTNLFLSTNKKTNYYYYRVSRVIHRVDSFVALLLPLQSKASQRAVVSKSDLGAPTTLNTVVP